HTLAHRAMRNATAVLRESGDARGAAHFRGGVHLARYSRPRRSGRLLIEVPLDVLHRDAAVAAAALQLLRGERMLVEETPYSRAQDLAAVLGRARPPRGHDA